MLVKELALILIRTWCRRDLLGLVLVKELALIDLDTGVRMGDVKMRALPVLRADTAMCAAPHNPLNPGAAKSGCALLVLRADTAMCALLPVLVSISVKG